MTSTPGSFLWNSCKTMRSPYLAQIVGRGTRRPALLGPVVDLTGLMPLVAAVELDRVRRLGCMGGVDASAGASL